ncbi:GDSL-type esterase/lipase family protein [Komagataeibacter xylinus]|uniref:GDSL-type esterase/lipase family protein n=1 Tax=Komagataeibacter xylinus TaxID=28448 RepID=UPI00280BDE04|nr:GDSL-type esterase/lipase family protein [Komagataeibacter xylinus]
MSLTRLMLGNSLFRNGFLSLFCAVLLMGCAASRDAAPARSIEKLGRYSSVAPFYKALDALQAGKATEPVTILQIGDSHTANDAFSDQMRTALQQQFGNAGRGFLQPGVPFRYAHPAQVTVASTGWNAVSAFSKTAQGPWGISLFRQHADGPASMTITADEPGGLGRGRVEFLSQPGGGQIVVQADTGGRVVIPTASAQGTEAQWLRMPTTPDTRSVTVSAIGDGPVDILGWEAGRGTQTRPEPGILYSNLGVIGSTIDILGRVDPKILSEEIRRLRPSLLIVAFGTNEGFNSTTGFESYAARYEQVIQELHNAAPMAGLVVTLPPDGVHPERQAPYARSCDQLASGARGFATPPALDTVRRAQTEVARRNHWMQWDWRQAMADATHPDGRCTILVWGSRTPPMAAKDHVHLLKAGYQQTAVSLHHDLMEGYGLWSSKKHKK